MKTKILLPLLFAISCSQNTSHVPSENIDIGNINLSACDTFIHDLKTSNSSLKINILTDNPELLKCQEKGLDNNIVINYGVNASLDRTINQELLDAIHYLNLITNNSLKVLIRADIDLIIEDYDRSLALTGAADTKVRLAAIGKLAKLSSSSLEKSSMVAVTFKNKLSDADYIFKLSLVLTTLEQLTAAEKVSALDELSVSLTSVALTELNVELNLLLTPTTPLVITINNITDANGLVLANSFTDSNGVVQTNTFPIKGDLSHTVEIDCPVNGVTVSMSGSKAPYQYQLDNRAVPVITTMATDAFGEELVNPSQSSVCANNKVFFDLSIASIDIGEKNALITALKTAAAQAHFSYTQAVAAQAYFLPKVYSEYRAITVNVVSGSISTSFKTYLKYPQ